MTVLHAYFAVYEEFNDSDSNNIVKTVGDLRAGMLSTSSSAFLGGLCPWVASCTLRVRVSSRAACHCRVSRTWRVISPLAGSLDGNFEMQGACPSEVRSRQQAGSPSRGGGRGWCHAGQ